MALVERVRTGGSSVAGREADRVDSCRVQGQKMEPTHSKLVENGIVWTCGSTP